MGDGFLAERPRTNGPRYDCRGDFIDAGKHAPVPEQTPPTFLSAAAGHRILTPMPCRSGSHATVIWYWGRWPLAAALLVACAARRNPTEWPGSSRSPADSSGAMPRAEPRADDPLRATRLPPPTNERLIEPATLASLVPATSQPKESLGHQPPDYLVQILVSPDALANYRAWGPGSSLPSGTWLVARHSWRRDPDRAGEHPTTEPAPLYVMARGPKGWLYAAATPEGWRIPVAEDACHDCHTQARADQVFGPREEPRASDP